METYICAICNEERWDRKCRDHEFVDKVIPDERQVEIDLLQKKLDIAIRALESMTLHDCLGVETTANEALSRISDLDWVDIKLEEE